MVTRSTSRSVGVLGTTAVIELGSIWWIIWPQFIVPAQKTTSMRMTFKEPRKGEAEADTGSTSKSFSTSTLDKWTFSN